MRNYISVRNADGPNDFVFFNGMKVTETQEAYDRAMILAGGNANRLSLYQLPENGGPWDRLQIIGYRRRGEILAELSSTSSDQDRERLERELERLDRVYYSQGRDLIPLELVAA